LLWHLLDRWLCPREVTSCSGICSIGGLAESPPHNFCRPSGYGKTSGVRRKPAPKLKGKEFARASWTGWRVFLWLKRHARLKGRSTPLNPIAREKELETLVWGSQDR